MPAYEYECAACKHRFEQRKKMSDPPVSVCPTCGGSVRRLIGGGAGVISKGSGSSASGAASSCDFGGACCGQGNACCGSTACDN